MILTVIKDKFPVNLSFILTSHKNFTNLNSSEAFAKLR